MELVNSYSDIICKEISFILNINFDINLSYFQDTVTSLAEEMNALVSSRKILLVPEKNYEEFNYSYDVKLEGEQIL